jgi:hypothetical protein
MGVMKFPISNLEFYSRAYSAHSFDAATLRVFELASLARLPVCARATHGAHATKGQ